MGMIVPSRALAELERAPNEGDPMPRFMLVAISPEWTREQLIAAFEKDCPAWNVTVSAEVDSVVTVSATPKE